MYATYNESSVTRCLWLDADVTITLIFGAFLSEQMSECAPLCTAAFLRMYPPNRVDVIACDPPTPPTQPLILQQLTGGPPVLQA